MDLRGKKILITGAGGFLGSFVVEELLVRGVERKNISAPRSSERDLRVWENCKEVTDGIDVVIHLAGIVGGIGFNKQHPGELFFDNIVMGAHLMEASRKNNVQKFVGLGTVCSYPKFTPVPFREGDLWNGYPEETNAPYGLAKKMLLVQAQAYHAQYGFNAVTLFPVNLYGPRDHFNLENSHVIPALIRKIWDAKRDEKPFVEAWGTGKPTREFLYVKDAARGIVMAVENYDKPDPANLGSGMEISVRDLMGLICRLMGYTGEIRWDASRPDGQPRRSLDVSRAEKEFGFRAQTSFEEGLKETIVWWEQEGARECGL